MIHYNPLAPKRLVFLLVAEVKAEEPAKFARQVAVLMMGAGGEQRTAQPDLVVGGLDVAERMRMQFTHGWKWRRVPGADRPAPRRLANARRMALASLAAMRRTAAADFAFGWPAGDKQRLYDPRWFTMADLAVGAKFEPSLLCEMTGAELIDIHDRWLKKGAVLVVPSYNPADIDAEGVYRIAMTPWLSWQMARRHKNLRNVRAGPRWRVADAWEK